MQKPVQNAPEVTTYRFDRFTIDLRSVCLRVDETPVPLRPKSFDVLVYLVRNRGRLVSKDELFEKVWSDVIVTDNSLVQCIKDVRQALKDDSQTIVETVAKRGYIFVPAVVEIDDTKPIAVAPAQIGGAVPLNAELPATKPTRRSVWIAATAAGAFMAALLVAGGFWLAPNPTATQEPLPDSKRLAIAVMPFGAPDAASDDYFSTGISEDIADALGRFSEFAVASPKVVSRFRNVGGFRVHHSRGIAQSPGADVPGPKWPRRPQARPRPARAAVGHSRSHQLRRAAGVLPRHLLLGRGSRHGRVRARPTD